MKTTQKLSSLLSIVAILFTTVLSLFVVPQGAEAALLTGAKVTLADSAAGNSSAHTFVFTTNSGSTLTEIQFRYSTTATNSTKPNGLDLTDGPVTLGTVSGLTGTWTLNTGSAGSGLLQLEETNGGRTINADTGVSVQINAVTNHAIDDCQAGGDASADTCFVQIKTCSDTDYTCSTTIDNTVITYTVIEAVTVTARVNPSFTLVIGGVNADTVNSAITTSAASTFSTLPFSNLSVGTPKYLAHRLTVTTNANSGYSVNMLLTQQMTGTYSGNEVDPFTGTSATWAAPEAWASPDGTTANDETGWLGANTTDTDVGAGWASPNGLFGPVPITGTGNTVMTDSDSDDGSTSVYVTYGIEVNAYQPSDSYSGTLVYIAVANY